MTAINIVKFRNIAHVAADASQVHCIAHLPAAIACQVPGAAFAIGSRFAKANSFDELLADFPDLPHEAFLAGWSARRERAEAYRIRPGGKPEAILGTCYLPIVPG
jgi:hypothetical protein